MNRSFDRTVAVYILIRLLLGLVLLGVTAAALAQRESLSPLLRFEFGLSAVLLAAMGTSAALLRRFGDAGAFTWSQMALDAGFVTVMVLMSGGPASPYFLLYFLNIVAAAWMLAPPGPLSVAALDVVSYAALLVWNGRQYMAVDDDPSRLYTQVLMQSFGLLLVGVLANALASKLRRARAALADQVARGVLLRERHRVVLDQLSAGVIIADEGGVVRAVNPAGEVLLGAIMGEPLGSVLQPEGDQWEQVRGGGRQILRCSSSALEGGGQVVLVEDVTLLREMESVMKRDERLAAVGRLAAGLAHEIRNPLAALSGSVQLLQADEESPLHGIVLREVARLNDMVEEFLFSARPVELHPLALDVEPTLREVVSALRNDARLGARTLEVQAQGPLVAWVDPDRLRQVLWNLLLNAVQATGPAGRITLSAALSADQLEISVRDDGAGIAPEVVSRIFDPFFTSRSGGTGLGLANVERIIRLHGGTIEVQSEPGQGALFTLRLPREPRS